MIHIALRTVCAALAAFALAACSREAPAPTPAAEPPAPVADASVRIGDLRIVDAWTSPSPGGASVAAAYMTIVNDGAAPDRLISASSARAGRVEIHETIVTAGMMQMRAVPTLDIPSGGAVMLAPEGLHVMLFDIAGPFEPGQSVPIDLTFEKAGTVSLEAPVRARTGGAATGGEHAGH